MGAEAIKKLLADIDCDALSAELQEQLKDASGQKKAKSASSASPAAGTYEPGRELTEAEKAIIAFETSRMLNEQEEETDAASLDMNALMADLSDTLEEAEEESAEIPEEEDWTEEAGAEEFEAEEAEAEEDWPEETPEEEAAE